LLAQGCRPALSHQLFPEPDRGVHSLLGSLGQGSYATATKKLKEWATKLQGEHTSKAGLTQEEKGGQNQAPADAGPRDSVGPSGGNRENLPPQSYFRPYNHTAPYSTLLEDMMQEMDISAADDPTSGVTSSPIRLWFTAPELCRPLIVDNHDRPLLPRVGPFLREYLSRH